MLPDAERALVAVLREHLAVPVAVAVDAHLQQSAPCVRLCRVGGDDDGFRVDRALVDVDAFDSSWARAAELAGRVRAFLLTCRGVRTPAGLICKAATVSAPAHRPWDNPGLRRFGATYQVWLHATRTPTRRTPS